MLEIPASEPEYSGYRESRSFTHVAGFSVGTLTLTGSGNPLQVAASWGTVDFFSIMGTEAILGRVFAADEQQPGQTLPIAAANSNVWNHFLNVIADLKPQVTLEQARSEMATVLD